MLTLLLGSARVIPIPEWLRDLPREAAYRLSTIEWTNLLFFALLPVPAMTLATTAYLMYADNVRQRELTCLALNVYHEARGEPMAGQLAVAEVTMNRVASPRYPATICEVVYEKRWDRLRRRYVSAFSWTELDAFAKPDEKAWRRAREAAENVYAERHAPSLDGALFYHSKRIRPSWARKKTPVATIGRHVFYR